MNKIIRKHHDFSTFMFNFTHDSAYMGEIGSHCRFLQNCLSIYIFMQFMLIILDQIAYMGNIWDQNVILVSPVARHVCRDTNVIWSSILLFDPAFYWFTLYSSIYSHLYRDFTPVAVFLPWFYIILAHLHVSLGYWSLIN